MLAKDFSDDLNHPCILLTTILPHVIYCTLTFYFGLSTSFWIDPYYNFTSYLYQKTWTIHPRGSDPYQIHINIKLKYLIIIDYSDSYHRIYSKLIFSNQRFFQANVKIITSMLYPWFIDFKFEFIEFASVQ